MEDVKTCSVHKYAKKNRKSLNLSDEFTANFKIKPLRLISFLKILPLVRGNYVTEGNLFDKTFQEFISKLYLIYEC